MLGSQRESQVGRILDQGPNVAYSLHIGLGQFPVGHWPWAIPGPFVRGSL